MRVLGLRNTVTTNKKWYYLVFYDVDRNHDMQEIEDIYRDFKISFICYKTLNGYHYVGLTPVDAYFWGCSMIELQYISPSYYSGQTIRLSRKPQEQQELVSIYLDYPVIPNLYEIYRKRFKSQEPKYITLEQYKLVFEEYRTRKESIVAV